MKKNVGKTDRTVRFVLAIVFLALYATVFPSIWMLILAVLMLVTAGLNYCPLWAVFKFSTVGK